MGEGIGQDDGMNRISEERGISEIVLAIRHRWREREEAGKFDWLWGKKER